jgi:hypothetical protein
MDFGNIFLIIVDNSSILFFILSLSELVLMNLLYYNIIFFNF